MDTTHTFPVPELEIHKLDDLQYQFEHDYLQRTRNFISDHHWPLLGIAAVAGVALGWFLRERN